MNKKPANWTKHPASSDHAVDELDASEVDEEDTYKVDLQPLEREHCMRNSRQQASQRRQETGREGKKGEKRKMR